MGSGMIVKCRKCDFSKELLLGCGMYQQSFDKILQDMNDKSREVINGLMKEYEMENFQVVREVFYCDKCRDIFDKSVLNIEFFGGVKFEEEIFCNKCSEKLIKITNFHDIEYMNCPSCNEGVLTYINNFIYWD